MKKKDSGKISKQELMAGCILLYELLPDKFTFHEAKQKASLGILDVDSLLTMLMILVSGGALNYNFGTGLYSKAWKEDGNDE